MKPTRRLSDWFGVGPLRSITHCSNRGLWMNLTQSMISGMTDKVQFDENELRDIAGYTELMRVKEKELAIIADKRTAAARRHQSRGVSYDQMGAAMKLSGVAVYKILRGRDGRIRDRKGG